MYNSDSFTFIRGIMITGSCYLRGLVSCSFYNCLYARDPRQKMLCRHDLVNNVTIRWPVSGCNCKLSMTKSCHLLVLSFNQKLMHEYTTHGSLLREIRLDDSVDRPWHCVQLSTGNFVVSHEGVSNFEYVL